MVKNLVKKSIENGFSPIPRFKDGEEWKLRTFINKDTGEYGYPLNHKAWNAKGMPMVSLVLQNCVLIDLDANKENCEHTIDELKELICETLNIDAFDLDLAEFQTNDKGDSLHYMFKLPGEIDFSEIGQSNDGNLIKNVDFKTGRQLVHLKPEKTVHWINVDDLQELPVETVIKVFKEKKTQAEYGEFASTDTSSAYGRAAMRGINGNATVFVEEGGRNSALAAATVSIYELVAGGEISQVDAESCINDIVDELGIREESDTLTTIEYNKKKGLAQPKSAPKQVESIKPFLKEGIHRKRAVKALSDASKFITDNVGFKISIDVDVAHAMLISCFWNPQQNKLSTINDMDEKVIFNEKDVHQMLVAFFGNPITNYDELVLLVNDEDLKLTQTAKNAILNCAMNNIIKVIKAYYQRSALEQRVDMFSERTYFAFKPDKAVEHHKHVKLTPPKGCYVDDVAIQDYINHFPMVNDVLDMIVAARFASSRKKAYLWIKAPSDWGKDFFRVALGDIATEMSVKEVEKAIEGAPVGKSPTDLLRSMVLVTNEFKKVKSELKQLEDGIKLSPKYQLETYVPLYTKLFMSAEGVDSLMGDHGVESQFANRFSMLDLKGNISELASFKRLGGHKFMQAVQTWFCERLNGLIDNYITMGEDEASRKGDDVVVDFHKKYSISNGRETLEDNIEAIADIIKEKLIDIYAHNEYSELGFLFVKSAKTKIKNLIFNAELFDRSEAYTISYKIDEIMAAMCAENEGIKPYRIEGKVVKALKISLTDNFDKLDEDCF